MHGILQKYKRNRQSNSYKCKYKSLKHSDFQPRGSIDYQHDDWFYKCEWHGDISRFHGKEEIYYRTKLVFTHNFHGGFFIN